MFYSKVSLVLLFFYLYANLEQVKADDWTAQSNGCIAGHNTKTMDRVPNLEKCKEQCLKQDTYDCRSVEFNAWTFQCVLSVKDKSSTNKFQTICKRPGWIYTEIIITTGLNPDPVPKIKAPVVPVIKAPVVPVTEAPVVPVTKAPVVPVTEAPVVPVAEAIVPEVVDDDGTRWIALKNACIWGDNGNMLNSVPNLEDCKRKCLKMVDLPCRSIEYNEITKQCSPSEEQQFGNDNYQEPCSTPGWMYTQHYSAHVGASPTSD